MISKILNNKIAVSILASAVTIQNYHDRNVLLPRSYCSSSINNLSQEELKKMVGYKSVDDYVKSNMIVGLGTGSTACYAVERLGQKLKSGELTNVICIPTSEKTKEQAQELNIPLITLNENSEIDIAIDGADEVDLNLSVVKGGGGALLREKMVAISAKKFIIIVDESKLSKGLGSKYPLPVEITPFCHEHTLRKIQSLSSFVGCKPVLRMGSSSNNKKDGDNIAITDNGNYIVDFYFTNSIKDVNNAAKELTNTVGVIEHGIFFGMLIILLLSLLLLSYYINYYYY